MLALSFLAGYCAEAATNEALLGNYFPYRDFQALPSTRIHVGSGALEVAFAPGYLALPKATILDWVRRSAHAVANYFGRLPDAQARLLVVPVEGRGVRGGTTFGARGVASRIVLGRDTTEDQLEHDWILVHELVHQGFPSVDARHHWLEEGLATYVEPIARAQAGALSAQAVWRDLVVGLPKGLPRAGDRGLDHTPTWGRTYWGGALFYLLADIEIRRRTENRYGLQHALRAIVSAGGNIGHNWTVEKVLATGDAGTGVHVLRDLYRQMSAAPVDVNLADLWRQLGVSPGANHVNFDDSAPLAAIRRAITATAGCAESAVSTGGQYGPGKGTTSRRNAALSFQ